MTSTIIRRADLDDPADLDAIVEQTVAFAAEGGRQLDWSTRHALGDQLRRRAAFVLVAVDSGDRIVGHLMAQRVLSSFGGRECCNIHDLYLREEARGRGLGRRLMDSCEEHARALGCGRLTLEVAVENDAARGLYRSLGFEIPEERGPAGATLYVDRRID